MCSSQWDVLVMRVQLLLENWSVEEGSPAAYLEGFCVMELV